MTTIVVSKRVVAVGRIEAEAGRVERTRRRSLVGQRCERSRRVLTQVQACAESADVAEAQRAEVGDEVAHLRKYTEAMLRRYRKLRMGAGRVTSAMDREMFRGKMSHYKVRGFDDAVIFCVDVERCLAKLNETDRSLLQRAAVQEYSMGEVAGVLGVSLRSCIVLYQRALDRTTRLFLATRLLETEKCCQEGGGSLSLVNG